MHVHVFAAVAVVQVNVAGIVIVGIHRDAYLASVVDVHID